LRGLPTEVLTLAKTLFSRVVKDGVSQQSIRFGLVTAAIGFQPRIFFRTSVNNRVIFEKNTMDSDI